MEKHLKAFLVVVLLTFSAVVIAQETKRNPGYTLSVNSKVGETAMTKYELVNATLGVQTNKPELAGRVTLHGFTFKCAGRGAFVINGDKLTGEAIAWINRSNVGDYISLYDPVFQIDGKPAKSDGNKSVIIKLK